MSKMGELSMEIEELYSQGYGSIAISIMLNVPLELVQGFFENMQSEQSYDDSMDGDFDSAMTSAGHGTDEDYGYYGESEF
jgi:hypothetical protein